jgi:signal transduction histidine kinase
VARGDEVEVSVRDNGPGLPEDVRPHLFESFFTTKSQGLGLGLVIVQSIVERHHGHVRAENGEQGGAIFRVVLPGTRSAAPGPSKERRGHIEPEASVSN